MFLVLGVLVPTGTAQALPSRAPAPGAGPGYWLLASDGGVFPFGRASFAGGLAGQRVNQPVVATAVTSSGNGYWVAGRDGGVFAFGDAPFYGSIGSAAVRAPIVSIAGRPSEKGYWLAGADGGVFAFGDAPFYGGAANVALHRPIVAIASTPSGRGYWLTAADGAVFAFGDAPFLGSAATTTLNQPVVAMTPTPSGNGYWLTAADGAVLAYGDAPFLGSLTDTHHLGPIVGIARTLSGNGYWLASSDGGIFSFGDAEFYGSVGATTLNAAVVGIAGGSGWAIPRTPTAPTSSYGFDLSWPQCGGLLPAPPYGFGVVGVTAGHLFSTNPCLREQWHWATDHGSFAGVYLNTNAFRTDELAAFLAGPAASCKGFVPCAFYQWGRQGAAEALKAAKDLPAPAWWLDVETGNVWAADPNTNAVILRGMIDELRAQGKQVGVYSTSLQWGEIVGGFAPGLPTWVAGADAGSPAAWCSNHSFGGGPTWLVQLLGGNFDVDLLCPAGATAYKSTFAFPTKLPVPKYPDPVTPVTPVTRATPVIRPSREPGATPAPQVPMLGVSGAAISQVAASLDPPHRSVPSRLTIGAAVTVLAFVAWSGVYVLRRRRRHYLD
jgi:hypothetical protein